MNSEKVWRGVVIGAAICVVCLAVFLVFMRWSIQSSLNRRCEIAQEAYPHSGDAVAALLEYVQSQSHTLRERNSAVWALGQARDEWALEVLIKYYHGGQCDHENELCQNELKKAIELCKAGTPNILYVKVPAK